MNMIEKPFTAADADAVIEHAMSSRPLDPEIARRVRERSEPATEELKRTHGTLDVAVGLIREGREDESNTLSIPALP
jgi:hypothetical protein